MAINVNKMGTETSFIACCRINEMCQPTKAFSYLFIHIFRNIRIDDIKFIPLKGRLVQQLIHYSEIWSCEVLVLIEMSSNFDNTMKPEKPVTA